MEFVVMVTIVHPSYDVALRQGLCSGFLIVVEFMFVYIPGSDETQRRRETARHCPGHL